ncbi:hypothetical protein COP2_042053 [Malus domestica]
MQQRLRVNEELGVWDCGSPLYDSYELVSVSHLIERHLMALPYSLGGSRRFIANFCTHPSSGMASPVSSDMRSSTTREAKGSSSSNVGIRKIWKRKVFFGEGKDKAKKRKLRFSVFCNMIGLWRQKDQCRFYRYLNLGRLSPGDSDSSSPQRRSSNYWEDY